MFEIGKILKRAWHILWNYKVLWIFGVLLAITTGGRSGGGNGGAEGRVGVQGNYNFPGVNSNDALWIQQLNAWLQQNVEPMLTHPERYIATFVWIGIGLLLFILITSAITDLVRYVSETAVIRMVNDYEQTGTKMGFKQGWKMGWSRAAFRLWLIDLLVVGIPVFLYVLILIGFGVSVYFSVTGGNPAAGVGAVIVAIIALILISLVFVLYVVFVAFLRQFFARKAALEDLGVSDSIRQGWAMFRHNWKNASLMWLVMFGLWIGSIVESVILIFLLIPVLIVTGVAGVVVAAVPALIGFAVASLFAGSPWTWIIAVLVGVPFFALVFGSPFLLITGWVQVFSSSVWTLTYRELKTLESLAPAPALPAEAR